MKLIIQGEKIVATATDDYAGPESFVAAPVGFDATRMGDYAYVDGAVALALPAPPGTRITRLAFRNRFSRNEKVALEMAALDDPTAQMAKRQVAAALRAHLADISAATFVDLQRADTRAGVQMLESLGLLAAGRAMEILDSVVQDEERPI